MKKTQWHYSAITRLMRFDGTEKTTFTKEDVDAAIAAAVTAKTTELEKAAADKVAKLGDEIKLLQSKSTLTATERADLEKRMEDLKTASMSELQKTQYAFEQSQKAAKAEAENLSKERDLWKQNFTEATIVRAITDAASGNEAFSPKQLVALLRGESKLVEGVNAVTGLPDGQFTVKTRFVDKGPDGKPVQIELTPDEVVKRMTAVPEYQNLFKNKGTGGVGGGQTHTGTTATLAELAKDPKAYREARTKGTI